MAKVRNKPVGEDTPSDVVLSAEEVRRLADMVQPGECMTFPNGLVVDKRWNTWPSYPTWPTGWNCASCGAWVAMGSVHTCWRASY